MIDKIKTSRKDSGFTIVELLIVIVVIGILAAITIVSYTGITKQATAAQWKQDASSIVSVGEIVYNSSTPNAYPTNLAGFTNSTAKLPSNVTLGTAITTGTPSASTAKPDTTTTPGVTTYYWKTCAGAGFVVYYNDSNDALASSVAGTCTP